MPLTVGHSWEQALVLHLPVRLRGERRGEAGALREAHFTLARAALARASAARRGAGRPGRLRTARVPRGRPGGRRALRRRGSLRAERHRHALADPAVDGRDRRRAGVVGSADVGRIGAGCRRVHRARRRRAGSPGRRGSGAGPASASAPGGTWRPDTLPWRTRTGSPPSAPAPRRAGPRAAMRGARMKTAASGPPSSGRRGSPRTSRPGGRRRCARRRRRAARGSAAPGRTSRASEDGAGAGAEERRRPHVEAPRAPRPVLVAASG